MSTEDKIRDGAEKVRESLTEARAAAREKFNEKSETACNKCGQLVSQINQAVRRNPVPVMVGFAALGFGISYLVLSRRKSSFFDADSFVASLRPLRKRVRDEFDELRDRGVSLFEDVQDRIPDKPLACAASHIRDFGKNLKFW